MEYKLIIGCCAMGIVVNSCFCPLKDDPDVPEHSFSGIAINVHIFLNSIIKLT